MNSPMKDKEKKINALFLGLIICFGFPAIAWIYVDWKLALTVFLIGQFIIGFAKLAR